MPMPKGQLDKMVVHYIKSPLFSDNQMCGQVRSDTHEAQQKQSG